jgi:hypothetical protein
MAPSLLAMDPMSLRSLVVPLLLCVAAGAQAGTLSVKSLCTETSRAYDRRELSCAIPAASPPVNYRFEAQFSGGHDDTAASLVPLLNGAPWACGEGSKLSLFGEDGDVSLHCSIPAAALDGQAATVVLTVKWSHAEYAGFDLTRDDGR